MDWFILALMRTLFVSGKDVTVKFALNKPSSSIIIAAFYASFISVVFLFPYIIWDGTWRSIYEPGFLEAVLGNTAFNIVGHLLFLTAIKRFDVSYVTALKGISPLLFALFSFVIFQDIPGVLVLICMVVIMIGTIFVELSGKTASYFKNWWKDSGLFLIIVYTCTAAAATVYSKIAVTVGDPEAYIAFRYLTLSIAFLVIYFISETSIWKRLLKKQDDGEAKASFYFDKSAAISGFFVMCAVICEMNALQKIDMASLEALSKLAILMTLVMDYFLISKSITWHRWVGALLIITGSIGVILYA